MVRKPRVPHFITGIGDGNVNLDDARAAGVRHSKNDDAYGSRSGNTGSAGNIVPHDRHRHHNIRTRNERLVRMEEPPMTTDHWNDVFGNGDSNGGLSRPTSPVPSGPWQVSAFALLGMIVVISAIFLHLVAESSGNSSDQFHQNTYQSPYHARRRQRQRRMYKTRKKKTDEWSDDEEEIQSGGGTPAGVVGTNAAGVGVPDPSTSSTASVLASTPNRSNTSGSVGPSGVGESVGRSMYPYYYHQPPQPPQLASRYGVQQEHRHRRRDVAGSSKDPSTPPPPVLAGNYYLPPPQPHSGHGNSPAYFSPSHNFKNVGTQKSPHATKPTTSLVGTRRSVVATNSFASNSSGGPSPRGPPPSSGRLKVPEDPTPTIAVVSSNQSSSTSSNSGILSQQFNQRLLPTPPEETPLLIPSISTDQRGFTNLNAQPLSASSTSFASLEVEQPPDSFLHNIERGNDNSLEQHHFAIPSSAEHFNSSQNLRRSSHHQSSLILSPGNAFDETPRVGNVRRMLNVEQLGAKIKGQSLQIPQPDKVDETEACGDRLDGLAPFLAPDVPDEIPFMPTLGSSSHHEQSIYASGKVSPPTSILMDELKLVQMESGSSQHWRVGVEVDAPDRGSGKDASPPASPSFAEESSSAGSDISIPSGDPRKSIIHKRSNLTMDTDASESLQSSIRFEELKLEDVIGGGGFGQVWKATWRGTPVAVKLLTGSAQSKHIAKAVLEEFRAEINLLKGMRHPNICLYMGACLDPPNRAIITELAANGSAWDALRLPLMPPFSPCDGTTRGAWPMKLYLPDEQHGAPPSGNRDFATASLTAPVPPKGTWPWELVKRVACGAARGMAYLHSGTPPVLHRDLKSANLLLDESYTTKVCDFGLSRLKAKERSMTGNCGTVQWMAPEVLASMSYNEKADVYSYGIILWELLSRECPYDGMTAIQCALAVLNRDKRPEIPKWCPPAFRALINACVKKEPTQRPSFTQILQALEAMDQ